MILLFSSCKKDTKGPPSGLFDVKPPTSSKDANPDSSKSSGTFDTQ